MIRNTLITEASASEPGSAELRKCPLSGRRGHFTDSNGKFPSILVRFESQVPVWAGGLGQVSGIRQVQASEGHQEGTLVGAEARQQLTLQQGSVPELREESKY